MTHWKNNCIEITTGKCRRKGAKRSEKPDCFLIGYV
jgi:hypothetical protein